MKLLVLLAVLGAVSAQYKVYTGLTPYSGYAPFPYAAHPVPYAAHPVTYAAQPFVYTGYPYVHNLPLSFKPSEEKAAAGEEAPAVESRSKRSADEDQKADDATYVSTYAANTYPLTYTAGYPFTYPAATVYNAGYAPLSYHGCAFGVHGCTVYNGVYHGYTAPLVHSLKKRDLTSAEEDQQGDEATYVSTYAAHPYPLTYTAGYPYTTYSAAYHAPAVYSAANTAVTYNTGYRFGYPYRYFY